MLDFRRCLSALAVLAVLVGLAGVASAQAPPFNCTANTAVPNQLRGEGMTEMAGDVVIVCNGGIPTAPGQPIPQVNVSVFFGQTTVTSRLLGASPTANASWTESLLMLDEPGAVGSTVPQNPCAPVAPAQSCSNVGNGLGTIAYYSPPTSNRNIFQAIYFASQPNALTWIGIPIDPPGTSGPRVLRLTNVRINATAITSVGVPTQAVMFISSSPPTGLPIGNNAQQVVGFVQKSMDFSVSAAPRFPQCQSQPRTLFSTLRFSERFASAFKRRITGVTPTTPVGIAPQNVPGQIYGTESGFYAPSLGFAAGATLLGLADTGTRLKAVFTNIPAGVALWVDHMNGSATASLVAQMTGVETGPFTGVGPAFPAPPQPIQLTSSGGNVTAVWEVLGEGQLSFDTFTFGVYISYTSNPGQGIPGLGTATVNGNYAPTPPVFSATLGILAQDSTFSIPRFADQSTATNLFTINSCVGSILWPFVTNQAGFDTGMAIANTSKDPFGTANQSGTCTINFFGSGQATPNTFTTPSPVAAGTVYANLLSAMQPGFQGYAIARCNFQFGHGYAFIQTGAGAGALASGYLALIIPDTAPRVPQPFPCAGLLGCPGSGEQLGQ